jgi:hypothetical protein
MEYVWHAFSINKHMKPTITITSKHLTLIFGIMVGLIVLMLMMLRSPEANVAAGHAFPSVQLPAPDAKILQLRYALVQVLDFLQ